MIAFISAYSRPPRGSVFLERSSMSSTNQKVSVIIPVYNVEKFLPTCLDSVFRQTLKPFEVLVINDGSSDKTGDIAKSYGDKIVYLEQQNQGQAAARNAGLLRARGDFIAFLDADDYWLKDFLEKCVSFLAAHQNAVAVCTGTIIRYASGKEEVFPENIDGQAMTQPTVLDDFFSFWEEHDHMMTGSNVIRKSAIDEVGLQRVELRGVSEDTEYWACIATQGKWGFIPEPLWVGNAQAAATTGWFKRYKRRNKYGPTIEEWGKRVVPRLKDEDIPGFEAVRGRVAVAYAHNKILAGNFNDAFAIVEQYGDSMPRTRLTYLMTAGTTFGKLSWSLVCRIIRFKEFIKAWRLRMRIGVTND